MAMAQTHLRIYPECMEGAPVDLTCANGLVARCVSAIANENLPDAEWALEVLNRYGSLVIHPSDSNNLRMIA